MDENVKHPEYQRRMLRFCVGCGVVLTYDRKLWCRDCRPKDYKPPNKDSVAPTAQQETCGVCGKRLRPAVGETRAAVGSGPYGEDGGTMAVPASSSPTGDGLRFCAECRAAYQEAAARFFRIRGRAPKPAELLFHDERILQIRSRLRRRCLISGDMMARLALCYDVPYNSYGKLRAYIEEFDQLPPDRFLRSHREHPVVETLRELEGNEIDGRRRRPGSGRPTGRQWPRSI